MYKPELRIQWDKSVKSIKILEGNDNAYIVHTNFLSPIFLISERNVVDKRVQFDCNGIYYTFSSSIESNLVEEIKDSVRCKSYINLFIMTSDENYFHFICFNQLDVKVIK